MVCVDVFPFSKSPTFQVPAVSFHGCILLVVPGPLEGPCEHTHGLTDKSPSAVTSGKVETNDLPRYDICFNDSYV